MKKAIHHLNRAAMIALEISGAAALFVFFAWLGLLWRLSQGPIELGDFVKTRMENAFHDQLPDFTFSVGSVELMWGGKLSPLEFAMQNVAIARMDKTPVFGLDRLRVQLSKRDLVLGRVVPQVVHLYGPELRIVRREDGSFSLNVGEGGAGTPPAPVNAADGPPPPASADTEDRAALVRGLLMQLKNHEGLGLLDGLAEVDVSDAGVRYEDRIENISYVTTGSDIAIVRGGAGIVSTASVALKMGDTQKAALRMTVAYSWDANHTSARIDFTGVVPSLIAQQSDRLSALKDIDLPMSGSVNMDLDENFRPQGLRFALDGDAGTINVMNLYPAPVAVKSFYVRGDYDARARTAAIEDLKIDLNGPKVEGTANVVPDGTARVATVSATLTDMPIDLVSTYWPPTLTPDPRWWVTTHLSKGTASKATLDLGIAYDETNTAAPVTLRQLGGRIDFSGIKVDYFPPLEPVKDVAGFAIYDATSFNLDLNAGKVDDMTVTKSAIHITDLGKLAQGQHPQIDIAVALNGPLRTALKVLDSPPLKYPEKLGIKTAGVDGKADINVGFKFPIHKGLGVDEVKVHADAKLKDVAIPDMVAGLPITGGPMDLSVDNSELHVKGDGRLGLTAMQFDWTKYFSAKNSVSSKVTASLPLDSALLVKFGLPKELEPDGHLPATLTYEVASDKTAKLDFDGDLRPLSFRIPQVDYEKHEGTPGSLAMTIHLKDGKPVRVEGLDLKSEGMEAKGNIDFTDGAIRKVSLDKVSLGATDVAVQADAQARGGYDVKVTGRQLDATSAFADEKGAHSDAEAAARVTPLHVNVTVNRLITGKDRALGEARVNFSRNEWNRLDLLQLDGQAGGKVSLQYQPQGSGHALNFTAENAGEALTALGISTSIHGGKLTVIGKPQQGGGARDMTGTATIENFKINNAPVLARLLNAMSLSGILSLLNGEGLTFKKARVNFSWIDRGQPQQTANERMLKLSDGQTSGASLGLTFEGSIDQWRNVYDLRGTIVPISDISKFVSNIPLIGPVLTAGGEGIIAATYTITGPKDKPDVMVNPLSVLAPGILRKLFFEH